MRRPVAAGRTAAETAEVKAPGSARVSRAGRGVPPRRTFFPRRNRFLRKALIKVRDGETPIRQARETRALPEALISHRIAGGAFGGLECRYSALWRLQNTIATGLSKPLRPLLPHRSHRFIWRSGVGFDRINGGLGLVCKCLLKTHRGWSWKSHTSC